MNNLIQHTTEFALSIACRYIRDGGLIIDATCGNGYDTVALADFCRAQSWCAKIVAFDIQAQALVQTKAHLVDAGFGSQLGNGDITLIQDSHAFLTNHINHLVSQNPDANAKACLIMFNLGYLPGGDKTITTEAASTLQAVQASLDLLAADGLVCITMYSGHEEGAKEKQALLAFAEELDSHEFHVSYISMINQPGNPPEILLISRKD